jgi:hypothetical protein
MQTFQEWIENQDPDLYNEFWKKTARPPARPMSQEEKAKRAAIAKQRAAQSTGTVPSVAQAAVQPQKEPVGQGHAGPGWERWVGKGGKALA